MSNLSFVRHVGDGVTKQFALSNSGSDIGYLRVDDIHAYVDGIEVTISIQTASPHLVIFDTAPVTGSDILIRREMPITQPYSDFSRGNNFGQTQVNNTFLQQLYLTQEQLDGFKQEGHYYKQALDFGGFKLTNIAQAVSTGQGVEYTQWSSYNLDQDERITVLESTHNISSNYLIEIPYTATGGETSLVTNYTLGYVQLHINGVRQIRDKAFSVLDKTVTYAEALEEGDEVVLSIGILYQAVELSGEGDWIYDSVGGEVNIDLGVVASSLLVTINGVVQVPTRSYDLVGTILTLAEPLEEDDLLYIVIKN